MKRLSILSASLLLALSANVNAETLKIGATSVPHAEILEFLKPSLAKQGVELDIKVFTDYVQPNVQVAEKHLDANFFQHKPYLDSFNKNKGATLVKIVNVHIEPFGAYSQKVKSVKDLKEGARVAIPNDPSNAARALLLLDSQGLIRLKDSKNLLSSPRDIVSNPKKLKITELEAATLPRVLNQVDLALINTNYALEAKLNPVKDALFIEGETSPYANILVSRADNQNSPALKKLSKALTSQDVKKFLLDKYKGAVVPAF